MILFSFAMTLIGSVCVCQVLFEPFILFGVALILLLVTSKHVWIEWLLVSTSYGLPSRLLLYTICIQICAISYAYTGTFWIIWRWSWYRALVAETHLLCQRIDRGLFAWTLSTVVIWWLSFHRVQSLVHMWKQSHVVLHVWDGIQSTSALASTTASMFVFVFFSSCDSLFWLLRLVNI